MNPAKIDTYVHKFEHVYLYIWKDSSLKLESHGGAKGCYHDNMRYH